MCSLNFYYCGHTNAGTECKFKCEFCPAFYKKQGNLSAHITKFHPEKVKPDDSEEIYESENNEPSSHQCSKCDENFSNLLKLATHFNKEHKIEKNRKQCPICPKNYQNTAMMNIHIKSVHLCVKKKCKICDKIFALGAFRGKDFSISHFNFG